MAGKKKVPINAVAKKTTKTKTDKETLDTLDKSSEINEYVFNVNNLYYYIY